VDVVLRMVDRDAVAARLRRFTFSEGALVRIAADPDTTIPARSLVRIAVQSPVLTGGRCETSLLLAGGDALCGRILGRDGDQVVLDAVDVGSVTLPLEVVTGLLTSKAAQPAYQHSADWLSENPPGSEDRLLLTNGDFARGFLIAMDHEGVTLDTDAGESKIPFRNIVAGQFQPPPAAPLEIIHGILTLRSGGRLTVREIEWSDTAVRVQTVHGMPLQIEAERIARLDIVGGRWEWVSAREPLSFAHTPMLSLGWPYHNNRNVLGRKLIVGGEGFQHGIGVHSRSTLIYELKGEIREFVTSFGLDDDSGPLADVSVFILVDGTKKFEQVGVRRGKLYGPVRLDVARANRIELICDFGHNGDVQDRFDWIEAALIRE